MAAASPFARFFWGSIFLPPACPADTPIRMNSWSTYRHFADPKTWTARPRQRSAMPVHVRVIAVETMCPLAPRHGARRVDQDSERLRNA